MREQVRPDEKKPVARYLIVIKGVVQGVGFRPFVYHLAQIWGIRGSVLNSSRGVVIEAEGEESRLAGFLKALKENPPRLAKISDYQLVKLPASGYTSFEILTSASGVEQEALVPPDVAICADCNREIFDRRNRHYQYPFTNCTNCGPRFTIIQEIPYDRPQTSMASFPMCAQCAREYHDPADRRFHAQPTACPVCGPQVEVIDKNGKTVATKENWLQTCWDILLAGDILALKGLGGYHLACDAKNKEAVQTLRRRKGRDAKPFAVMCRDLETVQKYCLPEAVEEELLTSTAAPIVILKKRWRAAAEQNRALPEELAPGMRTLGVMLPYTPLHLLLFSGPCDVLVMTSGNYSNLPLVKENARAVAELDGIADYFLQHNREIVNRCDDSLLRLIDGEPHFYRRSRGYVPQPVPVFCPAGTPVILGIGGEMKNSFCLLKDNNAFMSQYIGEIDSLQGEENLLASFRNMCRLIGATPKIVAYDQHPGYASARIARQIPAQAYCAVQHHHAHLVGCLAENGLGNEEVIGVLLDGTGYGTDGCLWGFEVFTGNYEDFQRRLHLAYVPLPGGEAAVRQPWRTATAYLLTFLGEAGKKCAKELFPGKELAAIEKMVRSGFNSPLSSGCGRLFDAVAAILGLCLENTYEGQAAVELAEALPEGLDDNDDGNGDDWSCYSYEIKEGIIRPEKMLAAIVNEKTAGLPVPSISLKFHRTLVNIVVTAAESVSAATGIKKVALSGGTWQNPYLFRNAKRCLTERGFDVLYHRQVPANDSGLALGQALIAHWRWRKKCV